MAVNIGTLITGSMAIGSGGSGGSSEHAETIFTFTNNRTASKNISGELEMSLWIGDDDSGGTILDYEGSEKLLQSDLVSVDIGTNVTYIGNLALAYSSALTSVTIPSSVEYIGDNAFVGCSSLTNVTFLGKTMEQVPNIEDYYGNKNYPWSISDTSIIHVA